MAELMSTGDIFPVRECDACAVLKVVSGAGGASFQRIVDNCSHGSILKLSGEAERIMDACTGACGVDRDSEAVFVEKREPFLPEEGYGTVPFVDEPFNRENIALVQFLFLEETASEFPADGAESVIGKRVNRCGLVLRYAEVNVNPFSPAFSLKERVDVGKEVSFVGVELFEKN